MGAIINRSKVVLICSAILDEQEHLHGLSGSDVEVVPLVCGVGNVAAAVCLSEYLQAHRAPDEVLFVGSAGTYESRPDVFGIGISNHFYQCDLAVARGESNRPGLLPGLIETRRGEKGAGLAATPGTVVGSTNCPDSITLVNPGNLFGDIVFENMECYGLGFVARQKNLPFTAIFALTNSVGPGGSEAWRRNYRNYSQELQRTILHYFTSPQV
ncbi:MAG: hypothetical protein JNM27_07410 [Leptospirales bacterium]|nr:hypothetical protein [Leptospirales bacterium]